MLPTHAAVTKLIKNWLGAVLCLTCLLYSPASAQADGTLLVYDFELSSNPVVNADYVKSLGFHGIVTRCAFPSDLPKLSQYVSHVATLNEFRVIAYVNYDFNDPSSSSVWRTALPMLASAGSPLWVIVKNASSTVAVADLLTQMAHVSRMYGVETVIYPHWQTNIENAAEAAAYVAQIGHANLSSSLHTCHEIRSGNQYSLDGVVAAQAGGFRLVTIAGAEHNAFAGSAPVGSVPWDDAIKPLAYSQFDLTPFLQAVKSSGYAGPVVLQTFGIINQPGHLEQSLIEYAKYRSQLH